MKDASETTLVMKRSFNAPVETLYQAWTDPKKFGQWMGPAADMTCETGPFDVSVGGQYAFRITNVKGEVHGASGVFRQVTENQKLVFTWTWDHVPECETLVTVEFRGNGDTSSLTLTHENHSGIESRDNHRSGWGGSFDKLERLVADRS